MQTARKHTSHVNTPLNDRKHSARLEQILLAKTYKTKNHVVEVSYDDISIESRLEAENQLEQALIKMFGYQ